MKKIDLIGQKFGRLLVSGFSHRDNNGQSYWICQCDCGNSKIVAFGHLRSGRVRSCGCLQREKLIERNYKDITGNRYGKLKVIEEQGVVNKTRYWVCQCDCGNTVFVNTNRLVSGKTKSCGCLSKEKVKERFKKYNTYGQTEDYMFGISANTGNYFFFDKVDYDKIKKYCWREDNNGYIVTQENDKLILLHRMIMSASDGQVVDHINHNTADNRRGNLRKGTQMQNMMNAKMKSNNTSGTTGVWLDKRTGKWIAEIKIDKRKINLGHFLKKEDAIQTRKEAEENYFGEWSYEKSMTSSM